MTRSKALVVLHPRHSVTDTLKIQTKLYSETDMMKYLISRELAVMWKCYDFFLDGDVHIV